MYRIIGKCVCGGNVVEPKSENLKPHQKPKPQCMKCFVKNPVIDELQRSTEKSTTRLVSPMREDAK